MAQKRKPKRSPSKPRGTYCIIWSRQGEAFSHLRDFEDNGVRLVSASFVKNLKGFVDGKVHIENRYDGPGFVFIIEHDPRIECPGCAHKKAVLAKMDEEEF